MRLSLEDLYEENFIPLFEDLIDPDYFEFLRNISNLDPAKPTRFDINTTLEAIFEELMIEDWNAQASFSRFYEICRPESCSYSYNERPSLILLVSIISGVIGGLDVVLRLICPVFIHIIISDPQAESTVSSMNINQSEALSSCQTEKKL